MCVSPLSVSLDFSLINHFRQISFVIRLVQKHQREIGQGAFHLFNALPFNRFQPTSFDISVIEAWLKSPPVHLGPKLNSLTCLLELLLGITCLQTRPVCPECFGLGYPRPQRQRTIFVCQI